MKPFGGQRLLSAGTGRWRTGFDSWVPVLFLASGAAGLIYQVVWTQDLVLIFGDTTLAIVTAYHFAHSTRLRTGVTRNVDDTVP